MTDILHVRYHLGKLIERDTSKYVQVYVCHSSHKCTVTTLEQNGQLTTRFNHSFFTLNN